MTANSLSSSRLFTLFHNCPKFLYRLSSSLCWDPPPHYPPPLPFLQPTSSCFAHSDDFKKIYFFSCISLASHFNPIISYTGSCSLSLPKYPEVRLQKPYLNYLLLRLLGPVTCVLNERIKISSTFMEASLLNSSHTCLYPKTKQNITK